MPIQIVGRMFDTPESFLAFLEGVEFNLWRPKFITLHHTGAPDIKTWSSWQTRAKPVTDEQWLKNLAGYYGSLGWSAGPHFFVTPKNICVLSPPNKRGVHAVSFNAVSWGVEVVGDFDREKLDGEYREFVVGALAAMHIAAGLSPEPYHSGVCGLHFHRDDPKTTKTCPGRTIIKGKIAEEIVAAMEAMTKGDHPAEAVVLERKAAWNGIVTSPDALNVRAAASAKAAVLRTLKPGAGIMVIGVAMNQDTKWLQLAPGEWVAAQYVQAT